MKSIQIIRAAILFVFGYYIIQLLGSGDINKYIHPRFILGLQLSSGVFFILGLVQLRQVFSTRHHHHPNFKREVMACALLALPLVCGVFNPPGDLDSYMIEKKDSNPTRSIPISSTPADGPESSWEPVIDDNRFLATMLVLYNKPADYVNRDIEFTAFIYHQDNFPKDCFLAARFGITCCAADAQVAGLLCHFQEQEKLPQDQWVRVKGKLKTQSFMSQDIPVVEVSSLQFIEAPENTYVY